MARRLVRRTNLTSPRSERVDGIADQSTMATLHALLATLPPDAATPVVVAAK